MNKDFHEKAEFYLQGKMSSTEALAFEKLLEDNQELRDEYSVISDIHKHYSGDTSQVEIPKNEHTEKLRSVLRDKKTSQVQDQISQARAEYERRKGSKINYSIIAAIIVFALLIGSVIYFLQGTGNENLYSSFYNTSDLPSLITRGNSDPNLSKAIVEFQNKNYEKALELFESTKDSTIHTKIPFLLYQGLTNLETGNLNKAIEQFDKVIDSDSIDRSKGYWFKALAYLKVGDKEKASLVLQQIVANPEYFNHSKAKELLRLIISK